MSGTTSFLNHFLFEVRIVTVCSSGEIEIWYTSTGKEMLRTRHWNWRRVSRLTQTGLSGFSTIPASEGRGGGSPISNSHVPSPPTGVFLRSLRVRSCSVFWSYSSNCSHPSGQIVCTLTLPSLAIAVDFPPGRNIALSFATKRMQSGCI